MQRFGLSDAARQRQRALLAEAAKARQVATLRRSRQRVTTRARVARALRAVGYALLDAGHSLEPESWRSAR
ncbi:MAG TPA: hypothetical protein VEJ41_00430 [Candidatus Acidoferrales bacterium]|nr:hypothetical protein [Candidatus Acidoferrales bacterium]